MKNYTETEILESKAYKRGIVDFNSPLQHLEKLREIEDERFNFQIEGTRPLININSDGSENVSFGRLMIEHRFKLDEEMYFTIGCIIAMDSSKPIAKIYNGLKVSACSNLCIWNAEQIFTFNLLESQELFKSFYAEQFAKTEERVKKYLEIVRLLKSVHLSHDKIKYINGSLIESLVENRGSAGTTPIINGIKLQRNEREKYYSQNGLNAWLLFNSYTEYLNIKVHKLDIPEKALHVFKLLQEELQTKQEEPKTVLLAN